MAFTGHHPLLQSKWTLPCVRQGSGILSMSTHHSVLYTTSVLNPQESWLDYFEREHDATDVLSLLPPLTSATFTLVCTRGCIFLSFGSDFYRAMTVIHLFGTLSRSPSCVSAVLPHGILPDGDSVLNQRLPRKINFSLFESMLWNIACWITLSTPSRHTLDVK